MELTVICLDRRGHAVQANYRSFQSISNPFPINSYIYIYIYIDRYNCTLNHGNKIQIKHYLVCWIALHGSRRTIRMFTSVNTWKLLSNLEREIHKNFEKHNFVSGGGKAFIYFLFFFKFFLIFLIPVVSRSKKRSRRSTKHTRHRCDVKLGYEIANSQPEKTTKKRREENTRKFSATLKRRFFFLIKKKKINASAQQFRSWKFL